MDDIGGRIKQIVSNTGMSALEFSALVGIQRSSLSHLYSGRNKPSIDLILKIKKQFPDIDLEWLITGLEAKKVDVVSKNKEETSLKDESKVVTNVNITSVTTDNQGDNSIEENIIKGSSNKDKVEKILFFYDDGSFKEYRNRE
jgi:transcriptional regulator with XRE-family HTH domain